MKNIMVKESNRSSLDPSLETGLARACDGFAPVWPLDRYIAVNPWWKLTDQDFSKVAADMGALSGASLLMSRDYFRDQWERGRITEGVLTKACDELDQPEDIAHLLKHLNSESELASLRLVTDELDLQRDSRHQVSWHDEVLNRISRFCAGYFDDYQSHWTTPEGSGLYADWLESAQSDVGIEWLMKSPGLRKVFRQLPKDPESIIVQTANLLDLDAESWEYYCHALLLSVSGWASWCAYLEWPANPQRKEGKWIRELLAIRMAWEWVLLNYHEDESLILQLNERSRWWRKLINHHLQARRLDWVWQLAFEYSYQQDLVEALQRNRQSRESDNPAEVVVDAVFCIDVRSEPLRRHLEQVSGNRIRTRGFAGFFGLPIAYQTLGASAGVPHLPGLIQPAHTVEETSCCGSHAQDKRSEDRINRWTDHQTWARYSESNLGGFGFVESLGLGYGLKLFKDGVLGSKKTKHSKLEGLNSAFEHFGNTLSDEAKLNLVHSILKGMCMTKDFAPHVLLVGHGSSSDNNPHAASLDCGACCGQRGEVNSRLLALLLNDSEIRLGLRERGVVIPENTRFIAALHDTTLDQIEWFEGDLQGLSKSPDTGQMKAWFEEAGRKVREERAGKLNLDVSGMDAEASANLYKRYALDWAQVRPEWGLARNASFIAAPRSTTRSCHLDGRTFLHEYHECDDEDGKLLEQIMTAPMVVAHWINLQYYASTVDPFHYGAGNKVLHNTIGGNLGVLEGNAGDLRTGLPLQSVHDGDSFVHEPLRLHVFLEASTHRIERILQKHASVRNLVEGQWLFLFSIDPQTGNIRRFRKGNWCTQLPGGCLSGS